MYPLSGCGHVLLSNCQTKSVNLRQNREAISEFCKHSPFIKSFKTKSVPARFGTKQNSGQEEARGGFIRYGRRRRRDSTRALALCHRDRRQVFQLRSFQPLASINRRESVILQEQYEQCRREIINQRYGKVYSKLMDIVVGKKPVKRLRCPRT